MKEVNKLIEAINNSKTIILISHVSPDGDTLGSMLAMKEMLEQIKTITKIDMLLTGRVPDIYRFLPNIEHAKTADHKKLYQNYDLAIALDCASIDRLGDGIKLFRNAKMTANIDHHISNTKFADINYIDPKASACGQILFKLVEILGVRLIQNISTNLYASILTDTGGFRFDNTKAETLFVCGKLIEAGADPGYIYRECFENKPYSMIKLNAIGVNNAVILDEGKIIYTTVSRTLLSSIGASDDHIEGIAETLRQINIAELSMVFKETTKGDTKVSFRSNRINVCDIAKHFGGGGHKLAAGCTIEKNMTESINEVIPIVRKLVNK